MNFTLDKYSFMLSAYPKKANYTERVFKKVGIPLPTLIDCKRKKIERNLMDLMDYAIINNFPYMIIFEDDAFPAFGVKNILEQELKLLSDEFFSGIYVFGYSYLNGNLSNLNLAKGLIASFSNFNGNIHGSTAYLITKSEFVNYRRRLASNLNADIALNSSRTRISVLSHFLQKDINKNKIFFEENVFTRNRWKIPLGFVVRWKMTKPFDWNERKKSRFCKDLDININDIPDSHFESPCITL